MYGSVAAARSVKYITCCVVGILSQNIAHNTTQTLINWIQAEGLLAAVKERSAIYFMFNTNISN